MTKSLHILLMLIAVGLFLMPNDSYACAAKKVVKSKTDEMHSCCKKQNSKKSNNQKEVDKKCSDKSEATEPFSEKSNHACDGHCNHNSCKCGALIFSINLPQSVDLKLNNYILISKNTIISHNENRLPSGFHSIWLPPVIS
jgi:hypothetical protein